MARKPAAPPPQQSTPLDDALAVLGDAAKAATLKNELPSDAHKSALDDLLTEADHWLDGTPIKSETDAIAVDKLLDMSRDQWKAADADRKTENAPFDAGKAEVQGRYNPILADLKRVGDACKDLLTPWNAAQQEKKRVEAEAVQRLADEAAEKARRARENAGGDLGAKRIADNAEKDAKRLQRGANKAAGEAETGTGLRRTWKPRLTNLKDACAHYYKDHPGRFSALVLELAAEDIAKGMTNPPPSWGWEAFQDERAV